MGMHLKFIELPGGGRAAYRGIRRAAAPWLSAATRRLSSDIVVEQRLVDDDDIAGGEAHRPSSARCRSSKSWSIEHGDRRRSKLADARSREGCRLPRARIGEVDDQRQSAKWRTIVATRAPRDSRSRSTQEPRTLVARDGRPDECTDAALRHPPRARTARSSVQVATLSDIRAALPRFYGNMITRMIPRGRRRESRDPTTLPHVELPDERSPELRHACVLVDLLVEKGT